MLAIMLFHPAERFHTGFLLDFPSSKLLVRTNIDGLREREVELDSSRLLVLGATGLRETTEWSQQRGGYITITIDGEQIHKTHLVDKEMHPDWKHTLWL
jgi:hypothetical protein